MGRTGYLVTAIGLLCIGLALSSRSVQCATSVVGSPTFQAYTGAAKARFDSLSGHKNRRNNPHGVTAVQVGGVGQTHFNTYSANRAAEEAADLKITYDQFMALNGSALPSATNPLATLHDITAAGYTSNYIFCEDTVFGGTTPPWHELERQSDGGAVGLHTATASSFTEMDRYVTAALNTTVIPAGTWRFTMYVQLSAAAREGYIQADIYRVNSAGALGTHLGTATSGVFSNTVVSAIQMSAYISQQTGWLATDRIGVIVSGRRGTSAATMTWRHDAASGYASIMETPVTLLHNQMQGLNLGDYLHLTAIEKALLGTASWGSITGSLSSQTDLVNALAGKEPANSNIQAHIGSTNNPHSVTAAQAGAEPANSNIQTHIGSTSNPHSTTADQVLPSQTGQSGKVLGTNGTTASWVTGGGGGGTPGGNHRELQYNNNGSFAGAAFGRYSAWAGGTGGTLIITGAMEVR